MRISNAFAQIVSDSLQTLTLEARKTGWLNDSASYGWEDFNHYSFPMSFGSTAGPFGGIGGAVITGFQIDVIQAPHGAALVYAGGRFWKTIRDFQFDHNLREG